MKQTRQQREELTSATLVSMLWLTLGCFCLLAVGVSASQPTWWNSRGAVMRPVVTTNNGVVTTNYVRQVTQEDDQVYGVPALHNIRPQVEPLPNDYMSVLGPDTVRFTQNNFA